MRINSEEGMIRAIRLHQRSGLTWAELIAKSRELSARNGTQPSKTASEVAGA